LLRRFLKPVPGLNDLWRRAGVPVSSLVRIAEADGMREALGLARREALWAIKVLRDEFGRTSSFFPRFFGRL
jgi:error-prone DNA polymerase